nr:hypothetical protein [Tanacetum cinerariifolium]
MDDLKKLKSLNANENKPDHRVYVVDGKPLKSILKKPKQHGMNIKAVTTKEDAMNTKNREGFHASQNSDLESSPLASSMAATMDVVTKVPIWVNLHKVPFVAYSEDGLSLIATKIGKHLMLDAYTSSMCGEAWGHINFARALIEVSSDSDLKKEVTMAVLNEDETDYTREVISVEYEWQPLRPSTSNSFDVLNTMDVEDESGTPNSRSNQEEEHEERIKELDEFDEDVDEFIFLKASIQRIL